MARRARKRRPGATPSRPPRPGAPAAARPSNGSAREAAPSRPREPSRESIARGYARAREKDAAAREALVPLAPGERPWPIIVSSVLAAVFALANAILLLAGWEVNGRRPIAGGLIFVAVMLAAAVGMWRLKYWAVLGWQVLLAITFVGAMLSLLRAANVAAVILSVVVLGVTGPLFWLMIRQMARIQMPTRK